MNNTQSLNETMVVPCPICQKSVPWNEQSTYRPFCSHRCQLIDLGEWAREERVIASKSVDIVGEYEADMLTDDWKNSDF